MRNASSVPALSAVAFAVLATALRLPFLDAPLTADEGGYAEISRLWARGHGLYGENWVDRPQGLLLVFRTALRLGLTSVEGFRAVAAGLGAALVVLAYALGARVGGRAGGAIAALIVATVGASPFIEGFTLSGELIAAVCATAAILVFMSYEQSGQRRRLVAAGLLAGSAWMVKQSAFDAAAAIAVYLVYRHRRTALGPVAIFAAAALLPVAAGVVASGDPGAWYAAVVGYGAHASGAARSVSERASLFGHSLSRVARALGPLAVVAVLAVRHTTALPRLWLAAAGVGVLAGGNFAAHYDIQLVVPLALVVGSSARSAGSQLSAASQRSAVAVAAGVAVVAIGFAAPLWWASDNAQARAIWPDDRHLLTDAAVAAAVSAESRPGAPIYVLWAAADLYYLADRPPAVRYLWLRNIETIAGATGEVRDALERRIPALVVVEEPPRLVDGGGAVEAALRRNYRPARLVDGVPIYARR